MMQEVGLLRGEKLFVAGDMNGQVGKYRAEHEDYMWACVDLTKLIWQNI